MQTKVQEQEKEQHARIAIHHYHCDHLGTPMALTDQTGQVAWAAKLDPWGNVLQEYNPQGIHQAIRLPGQHHDRETGLYYNRHRYYDPVVGSYVNQDPIGLNGGVNYYNYPKNPNIGIDPWGLVDLNLFPESENIRGFANKVPPKSGVYQVGAHGNPSLIVDDKGKILSPSDLAKKIKSDPNYKSGTPVELLSCNTGKGNDPYAKKLANELGAKVSAPDQYMWYSSDGSTTPMGMTSAGAQDKTAPGKMIDFNPSSKGK